MPVDGLIAFAGSEAGVKVFGEEMAKTYLPMPKKLKRTAQNSADCPACTACAAIIAKKAEL